MNHDEYPFMMYTTTARICSQRIQKRIKYVYTQTYIHQYSYKLSFMHYFIHFLCIHIQKSLYICIGIKQQMMNIKSKRLEFIKKIIGEKEISSQEELLIDLQEGGFKLTQATLSRDLKKLKIAKASRPNGSYIYVLPTNNLYKIMTEDTTMQENYRNFGFISIDFSGNMAVIRTKPGYASSLAYDIDNHHFREILGTIAGDDTIMLVIKESCTKENVKEALARIIPNIIYY